MKVSASAAGPTGSSRYIPYPVVLQVSVRAFSYIFFFGFNILSQPYALFKRPLVAVQAYLFQASLATPLKYFLKRLASAFA